MTDDSQEPIDHAGGAVLAFIEMRRQNARVLSVLGAESGIAVVDFRALSFIVTQPEPTPKRIAGHLRLTTGATTSLLDRLEEAALVVREPHPEDRRSVVLRPTPRGADVIHDAFAVYARLFRSAIPEDDVDRVREAFTAFGAALRDYADAHEADED